MYLSKALSQLGPNHELLLRLPSYIGGVGALICITAASFRLLKSKAAIFVVVYLTALNPKLIVMAKEFKPYSFEVFIHALLTLWALEGVRRGGVSMWFWVACAASFLFCYNVAFLLPAMVIALSPAPVSKLWSICRGMFARITTVQRLILIAALVGILLLINETVYSMLGAEAREAKWGNKYNVFPVGKDFLESLVWYAEKTWQLIKAPGHLHGLTTTQLLFVQIAFFATYVLGILHLLQKRNYAVLLILCGPLLTAAVANILGYWPYGNFRTNLFLLPGLLLLAGIGFEKLTTLKRLRIPAVVGAGLIVAISFPTDWAFYKSKSHTEDRYDQNIILTDWHSWRVMDYYINTHPTGSEKYAGVRQNVFLAHGPLNSVKILQSQLARIHYLISKQGKDSTVVRVWIVVTKQNRFRSIEEFPLVQQNLVFQQEFDGIDEHYHPSLFELRLTKPQQNQ
jgi:hypothetical protein